MKRLAETYVKLIAGIKESLSDHIAELIERPRQGKGRHAGDEANDSR
jgi:predicted CopG family antitoxin